MENKIPIPTDNIFKFYALFGLMLFIFSAGSIIYVNHSTNELVFRSDPQLVGLRQIKNPSDVDKAKELMMEKRLEVAASDKHTLLEAIGVLTGFSILLMGYGFRIWQTKVQPIQDETARLQLEKLRYEVSQLNRASSAQQETAPMPSKH